MYPRLEPTNEWDTAAAQIIVEEAGGAVVKVDSDTHYVGRWLQEAPASREPLLYNKRRQQNPFFLALARLKDNS